jgi:uncharacterized protein (TIGR03382 family)
MGNLMRVGAIGAVFVVFAGHAFGQVVFLDPLKDNTLYQDPTGSLSNGLGPHIFAGNNASSSVRRAMLAFDVASAVPAGSIVTRAELILFMNQSSGGTVPVTVHRALADWGEGTSNAGSAGGNGIAATPGDATWLHTFYNTGFWSNAGGDFAALASDTQSVGGVASYTWSGAGMVADVQGWVNNPGTNFGWLVRGSEFAASTSKRFSSGESANVAERPQLMIEFTQVPAPGAAAVLGVGLLAVSRRRRG